MKKTIIIILFIFGTFLLSVGQTIVGNGNVVSQKRDLNRFSNIDVSNGVDLYLTQGDELSVIVKTDENIQNYVKTEVVANTLQISVTANIRKVKTMRVYVTLDSLKVLLASDGSDIKSQTVFNIEMLNIVCKDGSDIDFMCNANNLECSVSDGSDASIKGRINFLKINAKGGSDIKGEFASTKVVVNLNDGSDMDIRGTTDATTIIARGGSDVSAFGFKAKRFSLAVYDGSDAKIFVTENLNIKARQGSDVIVKGNPQKKYILKDEDCDVLIK